MKTIKMKRGARVEAPAEFKGVEAFQVVRFKINYFGNIIETEHDTKIMANGKQTVIGGDGYIPHGYEIN